MQSIISQNAIRGQISQNSIFICKILTWNNELWNELTFEQTERLIQIEASLRWSKKLVINLQLSIICEIKPSDYDSLIVSLTKLTCKRVESAHSRCYCIIWVHCNGRCAQSHYLVIFTESSSGASRYTLASKKWIRYSSLELWVDVNEGEFLDQAETNWKVLIFKQ